MGVSAYRRLPQSNADCAMLTDNSKAEEREMTKWKVRFTKKLSFEVDVEAPGPVTARQIAEVRIIQNGDEPYYCDAGDLEFYSVEPSSKSTVEVDDPARGD